MPGETTTAATANTEGAEIVKPFNEELRKRFAEYRTKNNLSLRELALEVGINATQVSKYLNSKPTGDVEKLEGVIEDVLDNEQTRRDLATQLFKNAISESVAGGIEIIRETNDIGLLHGEAGLGKTCGLSLYAIQNPSAILVTCGRELRTAHHLHQAIVPRAPRRRSKDRRTKSAAPRLTAWQRTVAKYKDSNRPFLLDNAHRLTLGALQWLFDFHDATNCPVALVGNTEVLKLIQDNDQMFSRIGLEWPIGISNAKGVSRAPEIVRPLLAHYLPEGAREVFDLALVIAEEEEAGHFRSLKKVCVLAQKFKSKDVSWTDAFKAAFERQVHHYSLERE